MSRLDPTQIIRTLRPDLRRQMPLRGASAAWRWWQWLVTSGCKEYRILQEDEAFLRALHGPAPVPGITLLQWLIYSARSDVQQAFPLPERWDDFVQWFYWHGVFEHELAPLLPQETIERLQRDPFFAERYAQVTLSRPISNDNVAARPFGVNLIGYAYGQLGIGEDLRMTARALQRVGVPVAVVDFPPGKEIPQHDTSVADLVVEEGPYAFNLFCMTALETLRFWCERGNQPFTGRYNIGYWPWELPRWPKSWLPATELLDEVWVSSRFIYEALAPVSTLPVLIMPLAVAVNELPPADNRSAVRARFGLPPKATLFAFAFDLNSSVHRKNPQAVLAAFLRAFPQQDRRFSAKRVGLVIKAHAPKRYDPDWERLKELSKTDARIHIIEETLPRPDLLSLYRACDCFVSLHRSEGFGRGIAEALLLGLHVITTGFSGNLEYCQGRNDVDLVGYDLVQVKPGQYPFGRGQWWAEPDVEDAAKKMRAFYEKGRKRKGALPLTMVTLEKAGERYRRRLQFLWHHE